MSVSQHFCSVIYPQHLCELGMYTSGKGYLTVIMPFGVSIYTGKVYLEGFVLVLFTQNFRPQEQRLLVQ